MGRDSRDPEGAEYPGHREWRHRDQARWGGLKAQSCIDGLELTPSSHTSRWKEFNQIPPEALLEHSAGIWNGACWPQIDVRKFWFGHGIQGSMFTEIRMDIDMEGSEDSYNMVRMRDGTEREKETERDTEEGERTR